MEDNAYPEWLWRLVSEGKKSGTGESAADLSGTLRQDTTALTTPDQFTASVLNCHTPANMRNFSV